MFPPKLKWTLSKKMMALQVEKALNLLYIYMYIYVQLQIWIPVCKCNA